MDDITPTHALSLIRPWPWVITDLGKNVENRTWRPRHAPGWIALHATVRRARTTTISVLEDLLHGASLPTEAWRQGLVAVARVPAIHHADDCHREGYCSPWASETEFHWQIRDVIALPQPIPTRGQRRLWRLDEPQQGALRSALERLEVHP